MYETGKVLLKREDLIYPGLSYEIVGCAFEVFKELGYGHSEKIYQKAMAVMFKNKNKSFREQVYFPVKFQNILIGKRFIDFVVEEKVVVELKKNFHFSKAHIDQVLNYLKISNLRLALLINFGREGASCKRIVNTY